MKYFYPCKPNPLSMTSPFFEELDRDVSWVGEVKKNGWRCLIYRDAGLTLWTRHKTVIAEPLPVLRDSLMAVPEQTILDGELVHFRTTGLKGLLYLFDVIMLRGRLLIDLPLSERRQRLQEIVPPCSHIELARQVRVGKKRLYLQAIHEEAGEGIVLKKLDSKYLISERSCTQHPYWLKIKKPENHVYVEEK